MQLALQSKVNNNFNLKLLIHAGDPEQFMCICVIVIVVE